MNEKIAKKREINETRNTLKELQSTNTLKRQELKKVEEKRFQLTKSLKIEQNASRRENKTFNSETVKIEHFENISTVESFSCFLPKDKKLEKGSKIEVFPYSQVTLFYKNRGYVQFFAKIKMKKRKRC